jgi:hypothetical protein
MSVALEPYVDRTSQQPPPPPPLLRLSAALPLLASHTHTCNASFTGVPWPSLSEIVSVITCDGRNIVVSGASHEARKLHPLCCGSAGKRQAGRQAAVRALLALSY